MQCDLHIIIKQRFKIHSFVLIGSQHLGRLHMAALLKLLLIFHAILGEIFNMWQLLSNLALFNQFHGLPPFARLCMPKQSPASI